MTLSGDECRLILWLEKHYDAKGPDASVLWTAFHSEVGNELLANRIQDRLEAAGIISDFSTAGFRVQTAIVDAAEQIRAEQEAVAKPDRVEVATSWARRNPVAASSIIALAVLTALASLLNNIIDIVQKLRPAR